MATSESHQDSIVIVSADSREPQICSVCGWLVPIDFQLHHNTIVDRAKLLNVIEWRQWFL
jgi:hypothetical protein